MSEPIRLLIVDDHAMVREGLRALLGDEEDVAIVAEADSGAQALARADESAPDVVLMDLMLPDIDGIETTRQLLARRPGTAVIVLTSTFGKDLRVEEAVQAGALGFLLKDVLRGDLMGAIRRAAKGQPTLHPEAQAHIVRAAARPPALHADLTAREMDVLQLIARGQSNKRIAGSLHLSEGTVKGYVSTVLAKLQVTDRTQAALYAVEHELV